MCNKVCLFQAVAASKVFHPCVLDQLLYIVFSSYNGQIPVHRGYKCIIFTEQQQKIWEREKCIQLQNYILIKTSDNVNTHTFSFNGAENTGPDTVDWTLTPPARERVLILSQAYKGSKSEHHHTYHQINTTTSYETFFKTIPAQLEHLGNVNTQITKKRCLLEQIICHTHVVNFLGFSPSLSASHPHFNPHLNRV